MGTGRLLKHTHNRLYISQLWTLWDLVGRPNQSKQGFPAGRLGQWPTRGSLKRWQETLFAADEFLAARISNPHSFRVLVVTDLLS